LTQCIVGIATRGAEVILVTPIATVGEWSFHAAFVTHLILILGPFEALVSGLGLATIRAPGLLLAAQCRCGGLVALLHACRVAVSTRGWGRTRTRTGLRVSARSSSASGWHLILATIRAPGLLLAAQCRRKGDLADLLHACRVARSRVHLTRLSRHFKIIALGNRTRAIGAGAGLRRLRILAAGITPVVVHVPDGFRVIFAAAHTSVIARVYFTRVRRLSQRNQLEY